MPAVFVAGKRILSELWWFVSLKEVDRVILRYWTYKFIIHEIPVFFSYRRSLLRLVLGLTMVSKYSVLPWRALHQPSSLLYCSFSHLCHCWFSVQLLYQLLTKGTQNLFDNCRFVWPGFFFQVHLLLLHMSWNSMISCINI
jgi:hypothetical protein